MVRKVKVITFVMTVIMLFCATCGTVANASYDLYDGNISSNIVDIARDILPNVSINDNYVLFRSGQYTYDIVVGDLRYENGSFVLNDIGQHYIIDTANSSFNNNYYTYSFTDINDFSLSTENKIVYSDIGNFPQLEERGAKFEIIISILIAVACLFVFIRSIFNSGSRK